MSEQPWKKIGVRNDRCAPHNSAWNRSSPFKPWNKPFGDASELEPEERKYYEDVGALERNRYEEDDE